MAESWPGSIASSTSNGTGSVRLQSQHEGIARAARGADGLILVLTALLIPSLLDVTDLRNARELVVAALVAALIFMLHDTGSRYRLESWMSSTRLPFRRCLPSFILACTAPPLILMLLGNTPHCSLRDGAVWAMVSLPPLLIWRRVLDQMLAHELVTMRLSRRLIMLGNQDSTARLALRLTADPMVKVVRTIDEGDPSFSWCGLHP